jgi:diketogulonate reductase-like aldo/keto reductase
MTISSLLTLNNGAKMPALGFCTLGRTAPERIAGAVEAAIATGYRLIDTAASYAVERQVGEGIRRSGMVLPARRATLAWRHRYDRHEPHRHSGSARR